MSANVHRMESSTGAYWMMRLRKLLILKIWEKQGRLKCQSAITRNIWACLKLSQLHVNTKSMCSILQKILPSKKDDCMVVRNGKLFKLKCGHWNTGYSKISWLKQDTELWFLAYSRTCCRRPLSGTSTQPILDPLLYLIYMYT